MFYLHFFFICLVLDSNSSDSTEISIYLKLARTIFQPTSRTSGVDSRRKAKLDQFLCSFPDNVIGSFRLRSFSRVSLFTRNSSLRRQRGVTEFYWVYFGPPRPAATAWWSRLSRQSAPTHFTGFPLTSFCNTVFVSRNSSRH